MQKVYDLYDCIIDHEIQNPKSVLSIIILETGWMECRNCSYKYNNLFGFTINGEYMRFSNIYECVEYFKRWQIKYYEPWKTKHPGGTYYDFLKYIKFAPQLEQYIRHIKSIERWLSKDLNIQSRELPGLTDPLYNKAGPGLN